MALSEPISRFGQRLVDSLPHAYRTALVHRCLQVSTYRARKRLAGSDSLKLLVDNSVFGHGRTHETISVTQRVNWPPGCEPSEVPVIFRAPIDFKTRYKKEFCDNLRYLPGIANLARIGLIDLMTSFELLSERNHHPMGRFSGKTGWFDHWLFRDIEIRSVDGYGVQNSDFDQPKDTPYINRTICASDIDPLGLYPNNRKKQIERVSNSTDPIYSALADILPKKCNLDAWHIRTSETYDLFCFLTMDIKLRRIIEQWRNKEPIVSLRTKVMTPKELGKYIGITPISPYIYELTEPDAVKSSGRLRNIL